MSVRRVLLGQKISYIGTHGGANKANRAILDALARMGWECLAIVPSRSIHDLLEIGGLERYLLTRGLAFHSEQNIVEFTVGTVQVHAVSEDPRAHYGRSQALKVHFHDQILKVDPDWVLVAAEDPGLALLTAAAELVPKRTIWLARSPSMTGVGPNCFFRDSRIPQILRNISRVIVNSQYLRQYLLQWAGVDSVVLDAPSYNLPPDNAPNGTLITIINPCKLKGIDIAIELAKRRPQLKFGAVPTWGTTSEDISRLNALANFELISPRENISEVLVRSRVVLVPSLWDESFGRIVIESMLHGIPVLASNIGGLPEAKLGVPYLLPVNPICEYLQRLDDRMVRIPVVPPQSLEPWLGALDCLLSEPSHYAEISRLSRQAACSYLATLARNSAADYIDRLPLVAARSQVASS